MPEAAPSVVPISETLDDEPDDAVVEPGAIVGRYRVLHELGSGAQGRVFRGEHLMLGYPVAIKVLSARLRDTPTARDRLRREARLGATVRHRHLASVLEAGRTASGELYLVMELAHGHALAGRLGEPLPPRACVEVGLQLCAALAALDAHGVVHRDVKPENVLVERTVDGAILLRLLDFGLAKTPSDEVAISLTREGSVLGTPYYMSPEQLRGADLDARSDLYSLGALLFECVTGRPPHDEPSLTAVLASVASEPAPRVRELAPGCPADLARAVDRALEEQRELRWDSPLEMAAELRRVADRLDARSADPGWQDALVGEEPATPRPSRALSGVRRRARALWYSRRARLSVALVTAAAVAGLVGAVALVPQPLSAEPDLDKEVTRAVEGAPADDLPVPALERSARGLYLRGEAEAALHLYRQVTLRDPARASAWRGRGLVAESLSKPAEARRSLRRYLSLDPAAEDRADIRARLAQL